MARDPGWRTYGVDVNPPPGYEVSVSPSSISLEQGISATYEVTVTNAGAPGGEWRFGSLSWSDNTGDYTVRSPIAVRGSLLDSDGDGVLDATDNCIGVQNSGQLDTDGDDFGNPCDCDFDQSLTCGIADFTIFRGDYILTVDRGVGTDMDCSGAVNIADFSLFRTGFVAAVPGPSELVP